MSRYVDGFVIPLRKDRVEDYRRMAEKTALIWKEHGALEYYECIGDDMDAKDILSFPQLANASPEETVVFAWVIFESREARDRANEKIMADPRLNGMMDPNNPIFDCKRMAFGGFNVLVRA